MPGLAESGPSYISSHSADVILSDIRPIKLKIEALRSINVLLDEFLYSILSTACSLSTDKLRASLLSLLPTTLGKEALLEAEVELRAYWDRTGPMNDSVTPTEDDSKTFHLPWAFELLRLKCEAYSTLNEADEEPGAESRIHERMTQAGATSPPKTTLIAPSALYLTAILEAMCEHILSNVGRVASRDSSRTNATVDDLFVALCEDHSIYGLFKTMKVYEQIEELSKDPKSRRSKSFSRNDKHSHSRTSSPHHDVSSVKDSSVISPPPRPRSRLSSEASTMAGVIGAVPSNTNSRTSFDKARAMKMFMTNSRSSHDRDSESQNNHETKYAGAPTEFGEPLIEDVAMAQEFDDLMRSDATMKVSLTPDRLKTMEVYKQEKDQRGNRRPVPLSFNPEASSSSLPSRVNGRRPSLHQVHSIVEDDEENSALKLPLPPPPTRSRHTSVSSPLSVISAAVSGNRTRSASTSGHLSRNIARNSQLASAPVSFSPPPPLPPLIAPPATPPMSASMMQGKDIRPTKKFNGSNNKDGFPARTRKVQRNRESIDLDDVMGGGSDDDLDAPHALEIKPAVTPGRKVPYITASTRELIDFLAEGPPPPVALPGKEMMDLLSKGPGYSASTVSVDSTKSKGTGRLQRMMSKLTMRSGDDSSRTTSSKPSSKHANHSSSALSAKSSAGNLSYLANRPIPPRPPPVVPPSPPSPRSSEELFSTAHAQSSPTVSTNRRAPPAWEQRPADNPSPTVPSKPSSREDGHRDTEHAHASPAPPASSNGHSRNEGSPNPSRGYRTLDPAATSPRNTVTSPKMTTELITVVENPASVPVKIRTETEKPTPITTQLKPTGVATPKSPTRKPVPSMIAVPIPHLSEENAQNMHRLFSKATTADECRLIFDMFLAKSGITVEPTESVSLSSTLPPEDASAIATDASLEHSLVELLLGGDTPSSHSPTRRTKKWKADGVAHAASGAPRTFTNGHATTVENAEVSDKYTPPSPKIGT